MKRQRQHSFAPGALTAAIVAALGLSVSAQADEVTELSKPESEVRLGVGYVSDDNRRFGQYTGMTDKGFYALFDISLIQRDEDTGTWTTLDGRNLGLENRDLRLEHYKQGDWGFNFEFSQTPRYEPYLATTAVSGIGTANLTVPSASTAGGEVELKTKREAIGLGVVKHFLSNYDFRLNVRSEDKDGERIFARGTTGAGNMQFTPEPINSTTRQLEAMLGYTGKQLQLSGGYYATSYHNQNSGLYVTESGAPTSLAGFSPIGLPPDNQSHQLYLAGGYSFTPTTRSTFKLAYAKATQNDTFLPVAKETTKSSLEGRVDTTQAQLGITSRPIPKLSLLADVRYEDRNDKTEIIPYLPTPGAGSTYDGMYEPRSITTLRGRLEAGYQLPAGFRVIGDLGYEGKKRYVPYYCGTTGCGALASVAVREQTEEWAARIKVRRSLSETLTGALSYLYSDRGDGTDYTPLVVFSTGAPGSNVLAPIHVADRTRNQGRLSMDWMPLESLSFHVLADVIKDEYSGRTYGPKEHTGQNYAIDAAYTISDAWQSFVWIQRNEAEVDQTTQAGATPWTAGMKNIGDGVGLGVRGKPKTWLELGGEVQYTFDRGKYDITTTAATGTLPPDSEYKVTRVMLHATYAVQKNAGLRLDYRFERWDIDDWTWSTWQYLDGTRLYEDPTQTVHFVGLSAYLKWQ